MGLVSFTCILEVFVGFCFIGDFCKVFYFVAVSALAKELFVAASKPFAC
jgi:hypothetical protein